MGLKFGQRDMVRKDPDEDPPVLVLVSRSVFSGSLGLDSSRLVFFHVSVLIQENLPE